MRAPAFALLALLALVRPASADLLASDLAAVRSTPRLGAALPSDAVFTDETGATVRLGDFFRKAPLLLALGYYRCRTICSIGFRELAARRREAALTVPVILVGIDPHEGPADASASRAATDGADAGWHFLTDRGGAAAAAVAAAAGLPFRYDREADAYAHAAEILVVDGEGRIAAALPELGYDAATLRRALAAADGAAPWLTQAATLLCYAFDPASGRYAPMVRLLIQAGAGATVLALGLTLLRLGFRR